MLFRDSQGNGLPSEAAQAGLCAVLAVFFALGGDRLVGIERGFYDLSQRVSATTSAAPVVIVQPEGSGDLWSDPRAGDLIGVLRGAGARVILPATPAPPAPDPAELSRLQQLLRLEERGDAPVGEPGPIRRQLAAAEERARQQQQLADAIRTAGNVVVGLGTTDYRPGAGRSSEPCGARITPSAPAGAVPVALPEAALVPAAPGICAAAAAIGHVAQLTDRDGVVRRAAPELQTEHGLVPPGALAALRLAGEEPLTAGAYARYYAAGSGAGFPVVTATDLLAGRNLPAVDGRFVVIGSPAGLPGAARTPLPGPSGPSWASHCCWRVPPR